MVDFELISSTLQLLYTTTNNDLLVRNLLNHTEEVLYTNFPSKCLLQDHYISLVHYFKDCEKLFVVS